MADALILDGDQRAALAAARSLAQHGIRVETASALRNPLTAASRAVSTSYRSPDPMRSASTYIDWLKSFPPENVVPITDASTMLVRAQDAGYQRLSDKSELLSLAATYGVPVPTGTVAFSTRDALLAAAELGYPVVLKPARSKTVIGDRVVSTSVQLAFSDTAVWQLLAHAEWFPTLPVIVQQFVPGTGAGVSCLFDRDHAIAWFAHRRVREKPPAGGVSVVCESIPLDPVLLRYAESLLCAVQYRGLAMIEFRIDPAGYPFLMEVNARPWGSIQLAIDCGIDFPWLNWRMQHGERTSPIVSYLTGRRMRWLLGDVDHLMIRMRAPDTSMTARFGAVSQFLASFLAARCSQEVFRWSDPFPAFREAHLWLAEALAARSKGG